MVKCSYRQLHAFLMEDNEVEIPADVLAGLEGLDVKNIVADFSMSENHIGGDDVLSYIDEVVSAMKEGYEIVTWYGSNTEALAAGIRPGTIELSEDQRVA